MRAPADKALGASYATYSWRLRKLLLFKYVKRANDNFCYRCGGEITNIDDFTIEHKIPWRGAPNPLEVFLDIENTSFSHHACNSAAARKPNKIYNSLAEQRKAKWKRNQPNRIKANKARRERLRAAGLPYT